MSNATMHRLAILIGLGLVLIAAVTPVTRAQTPAGHRPVTDSTGSPAVTYGASSIVSRNPDNAPWYCPPKGNYTEYTAQGVNESIHLYVPHGARQNMTADPEAVVAALANASALLRIGGRARDHVCVVVVPASPTFAIAETLSDNAIVLPQASIKKSDEDVSYFNDYVHTRQSVVLGPQMQWYTSSEAIYSAMLLELNLGYRSYDRFWERLNISSVGFVPGKMPAMSLLVDPNATLANHSSWHTKEGYRTGYAVHRGPPVLALLDAKIRRATHGNATLMNVTRTMNQLGTRDDPVTLTDFHRILERYLSNSTVNQFVGRYITDNTVVAIPQERAVYQLPPVAVNTTSPTTPSPSIPNTSLPPTPADRFEPPQSPPPSSSGPDRIDTSIRVETTSVSSQASVSPEPELRTSPARPRPATPLPVIDTIRNTIAQWIARGRLLSQHITATLAPFLPQPIQSPLRQRPFVLPVGGTALLLVLIRGLTR